MFTGLGNSTENNPPSLKRKNLCETSQWNTVCAIWKLPLLFFLFNFCKSEKPNRLCDSHPLILVIVLSANLNMVFKMCLIYCGIISMPIPLLFLLHHPSFTNEKKTLIRNVDYIICRSVTRKINVGFVVVM